MKKAFVILLFYSPINAFPKEYVGVSGGYGGVFLWKHNITPLIPLSFTYHYGYHEPFYIGGGIGWLFIGGGRLDEGIFLKMDIFEVRVPFFRDMVRSVGDGIVTLFGGVSFWIGGIPFESFISLADYHIGVDILWFTIGISFLHKLLDTPGSRMKSIDLCLFSGFRFGE